MSATELALRLCLSSHHGLTMAVCDMPCRYHRERATNALAIQLHPTPSAVTTEGGAG